ncbi:DUF4179 domain-containing protein [Lysinibacillus sp. BW-2-10]|uniref:DUF4179 domain-containing protein n=1 Tax=Lysinibacillus sp. BW-2-10 TaxID=2590030 RepID=UPI00117D655B|nr:DUF4179 domain-containing protein [Lysinibacillus sp. BW-2-10]TSI03989.1 DUF4179 domain-containing protein [Lysinibacillus sp. BW-2-10]
MSKFNDELDQLFADEKHKSVPTSFSKGIDGILANLPDKRSEQPVMKRKKKWGWIHSIAAAGILTVGILGSGFASPAMAAMLTKIPGLEFLYSATYENVSDQDVVPNSLSGGSILTYGENGPFNKDVQELQFFEGYTKELEDFVGYPLPKVGESVNNIRVDKYGEGQSLITVFSPFEDYGATYLSIVKDPIILPSINGTSVKDIEKESVDVNGVAANVLSYQFSADINDETTYIVWEREGYNFVLASSGVEMEKLVELAKDVDQQTKILN